MLQRLGDMTVAMSHVAVASLELATTLVQLLVGQLDVHGTGLDVDVDDVAVLDERHRALVRRLGSHVPMARPEEPPE
mgnify:CR=1 FL=1